MTNDIVIKGAKQHNLKDVSVNIPKNKLVVFTGISGSGKSSMAFDTIYAEGQRRYVESLSSYARQFLGIMDKPDVESIEGLSPSISIDQKATGHNPRSTVGTITEIYDYLRLLFSRIGHPHCPKCGREIAKQSPQQITNALLDLIVEDAKQRQQVRVMILSPVVRDRKGEFSSLFDNLRSKGFQRVRIDKRVFGLDDDLLLIKTNKHSIDVVLDRIAFSKRQSSDKVSVANLKSRLSAVVEQTLDLSNGLLIAAKVKDKGFEFPQNPVLFEDHLFSEQFACPLDNLSLPEIEPRSFSFNSPHGACPECNGIGTLLKVDAQLLVNQDLSLAQGAILPFARMTGKDSWLLRKLKSIFEAYNESMDKPWILLSKSLRDLLLFGDPARVFTVYGTNRFGHDTSFDSTFEGAVENLSRRYKETQSEIIRSEIEKYMRKEIFPLCDGRRLRKEALSIIIDGKNIIDVTRMQIHSAKAWAQALTTIISSRELFIARPIIKELVNRLQFLDAVGLSYLTLEREASTLAGGEAQRIRLASQIGSGLSGVLYVLDEPSIGLHQRDNKKLLTTLKNLRDLGNTVIVVEHDRETMENSDLIIDFGPGAGKDGGKVIAVATPQAIKKNNRSLTGQYLSGKKRISLHPAGQKSGELADLVLVGCREHNLKNITVAFPLGKLICVTGVSGSGKSTLVHDILYHALLRELSLVYRERPGAFDSIQGFGQINRVSLIDQSPIGRTPRSNPATYTKAFDFIRKLFANTKEAAIRGYRPGRFSFNVRGGRCEACQGGGQVKIEMQFLPDVYVTCEVCNGSRYNDETLEVRYRGKRIDEVLNLSVKDAYEFFSHVPGLNNRLKTLEDVGLGYIEIGQAAPTLSGGEAQRIKIAKELSVQSIGHTVYLLDEPTTGLHFADLEKLLYVLRRLVDAGNTAIIIEHNLDVIKNADWIIDLGPEGGDEGGKIVSQGTPHELSRVSDSYTGNYLLSVLHNTPVSKSLT